MLPYVGQGFAPPPELTHIVQPEERLDDALDREEVLMLGPGMRDAEFCDQ
jgi:hypothetical protein